MITFKAVVFSNHKRKDGTYPLKIRVTFKGVSRRLPTTIICTSNDLTRTLKIKSPDILNKSDALIARMRDAVKDLSPFDLQNRDVDWVVAHIKDVLAGENFQLDFFEWSDRYLLSKKEGTRGNYECAVNALSRFLHCRTLDINSITKAMVIDYMEFVDSEPRMAINHATNEYKKTKNSKSKGTSARYITMLAHIFNAAKDRYNDEDSDRILIPKSPFSRIEKNRVVTKGQKNIGEEIMQKMISYETDNPKVRLSLDVFIVSFGLMGANMVDLFGAEPVKKTWIYERSKTKDRRVDRAEMRVDIPAELKPYLDRLKGHNGHWLCLSEIYPGKNNATNGVNRGLARWCRDNGIEPFTFYAARHTWASLARKAGVEKATIDEGLVHKGDFDVTDIYAERNWDLMQEANRKVLGMFTW